MGKIFVFLLLVFIFIAIPVLGVINKKKEPPKTKTVTKIVVVTPTRKPAANVDLSYIIIHADNFVNIKLLNNSGASIGEVSLEEVKGATPGAMQKALYYSKPDTGTYSATLISPKEFKAEIYLYDTTGEAKINKVKGKTGTNMYKIIFNKTDNKSSNVTLSSQP